MRRCGRLRAGVAAIAAVAVMTSAAAPPGGGGRTITYQGKLIIDGEPANGAFDMAFDLYDAPNGGNFLDSDEVLGVLVTDGLFTVHLEFDGWRFGVQDTSDDGRRWLDIEVDDTGLSPRQEITATPFALQTHGIHVDMNDVVRVVRPNSDAEIHLGTGDPEFRTAMIIQELDGDFILRRPQLGTFRIQHGNGTTAIALFENGTWGLGTDNPTESNFEMVNDNNMLKVRSINGTPIIAETTNGTAAIIEARSPQETEFHVNSFEGRFAGNLNVVGNLSKGSGTFRIDHPLDPENKYLSHSFVESPEMMNIYNGNIVTDDSGFAVVELPRYFEALNRDFRYQLTVIDDSADFVMAKVAREIEANEFVIRTSRPQVKVSWQVTGVRDDAFARRHPVNVEEDKSERERGRYLHPEAFGLPKSLGIGAIRD